MIEIQTSRPALAGWQALTAAPHRVMFLIGVLQALLAMAWWLAELVSRYRGGGSLVAALPAVWLHALLLIYGLFPFFIFGFLLTVFPRWLGGPPVARGVWVAVGILAASGLVLVYAGIPWGRAPMGLGTLLLLAAWAVVVVALARSYVAGRAWRRAHETQLLLALIAGTAGLALYGYGLAMMQPRAVQAAQVVGLWLFLVPVVFAVSHRMIPIFTQAVLPGYAVVRPGWSLPVLSAGAVAHAALELAGRYEWLWLVDAPLAAIMLWHTWAWGIRRSRAVRLLAVLHLAFLWLGIALTFYTLNSLGLWWTGTAWLGRAPLHALTVGFLMSMTLAMATRVTLGHSGRALRADSLTWYAFIGLSLAALLRMAAELPGMPHSAELMLAAAAVWLLSLSPWVWRYLPTYWQPRVDGVPG